ncbi:MAG: NAD(P)-dependent glycerol-1-phosphate dehydrogenase [Candidatus Methanomethylophilaceae archaeon]|nr:NAD(P)-dependent glycerol-1-phosphate dehydrogenase [Candidatus Methanomethylophilaceae archaeon]
MDGSFLKAKVVEFPRNVIAGHDVLGNVREVCVNNHSGRVGTLITGDKTLKAAGEAVLGYMDGYDIDTCIVGNATAENVEAASKQVTEYGSDFILAVGGGSKIDIAKIMSKDLNLPFISIPTSCAHDGIASNRASLKSKDGSKSISSASPLGVIADTGIISQAPHRLLASGCADVISNLTAIKDWDFARRLKGEPMSRSAYALSRYAAESIIEDSDLIRPDLEESVWVAIKPIIISGFSMCIANSSRPTSGSEHMISHTIDLKYPGRALHGEQCGVASIISMYLHGGDWEMIRDALSNIGAPTTAKGLGLTAEEMIDAITHAHEIRPDRFTILGETGVTAEAAQTVAEATGVI